MTDYDLSKIRPSFFNQSNQIDHQAQLTSNQKIHDYRKNTTIENA